MSDSRRQHPLFVFFAFLTAARSLIIPGIVSLIGIANSDSDHFTILWYWWVIGIAAIVVLIFIPSFLTWYRYTYRFEEGRLKVDHGVFIKKRRYISRERIQSIDESTGIFHRMFNLVKITVETAGGKEEPEVVLTAVKKEEAQRLRLALAEQEVEDQGEIEKDDSVEFKLTFKRLLFAGATSGKIGVVLTVIGGISSQIDEFIRDDFVSHIFHDLLDASFTYLAVLLLTAAVFAWILAILGTVLKYGGFTVTLKDDELHIVHGLLEKRQLTIPVNRIQAVRKVEGLMRQPFGYAALYVESAGGGGKKEDYSTVLFPLLRENEVIPFLEKSVPRYACKAEIKPLPKRSARRYILMPVLINLFVAFAASFFTPWGYFLFIPVPFIGLLRYFAYKDAGWAIKNDQIFLRFRGLARTTVIIPKGRLQATEMKQSFLQKRAELVSPQVSVISSLAGKHFKVEHLEEKDGECLLEWYANKRGEG